ncbi:hypothetical protein TNCV_2069691 [Trichonephila clavipes]|uniref:Uncharacterized protein n=1 Tax=Trichonephila clavipes TaxID=2585209 RepID=A0A8X7BE64_TRICX|nr:hypothetical protein TNCV_2069691 [Trichonephila clavipes]
MGSDFIFIDDKARPHRAHITDESHDDEDTRRMGWLLRSSDVNPFKHAWDGHGRAISQCSPPVWWNILRICRNSESA